MHASNYIYQLLILTAGYSLTTCILLQRSKTRAARACPHTNLFQMSLMANNGKSKAGVLTILLRAGILLVASVIYMQIKKNII